MGRLLIALTTVLCLAVPHVADAQGRGRPKAPRTAGGGANESQGPTGGAGGGGTAAPAFRQFGAWLDDASAPTPGEARIGIGAGYWRSETASLVDVPIVDASIGITDQLQFAATVPFYRSSYAGTTTRGLDDVYLSGKWVAVDAGASSSGVGLAVTPVLEILSAGYADDRLHWALPISVELRASPVRVYGSAGYFSRGSAFAGAALEWSTPRGPVLTGALTQSFSTASDPAATVSRRTDVSMAVAHALADAVAAYLSVGRSIAAPPGEGTTFGIAAGLSFTFTPRRSAP